MTLTPVSSVLVAAEGRTSALSEPLVPQETSCQLPGFISASQSETKDRLTERVNVQNVGVGRSHEKVLEEAGKHVPRVEVHERRDEVKTVGGDKGDNDNTVDRAEELLDVFGYAIGLGELVPPGLVGKSAVDEVERKDNDIKLNQRKHTDRHDVSPFGTIKCQ